MIEPAGSSPAGRHPSHSARSQPVVVLLCGRERMQMRAVFTGIGMAFAIAATFGQSPAPTALFDYPPAPTAVQSVSAASRGDIGVREITYAKATGGRNAATLIVPAASAPAPHPAILFVHWYEPPNPTSNRSEFVEDAVDLARAGVVSLLIDTPWSEPTWFPKRDGDKDYAMSVAQVKELRRALDVLLEQPDLDRRRVALVGHDFGA